MSYVNPIWLEGRRRYWQRHDWQRFIRHDAHRFLTPAGIAEEKRAAEAQAATRREAEAAAAVEHEAFYAEHLELRRQLADVKFELAFRRIFHKYRPDQPRDDRGRWVDDPDKGGSEDAGKEGEDKPSDITDVSAARKPPPIVNDFGKWTARQFASRYCEARINRELPGQFEDMTISDIWNIAKGGDARARTCLKLLNSGKFRK